MSVLADTALIVGVFFVAGVVAGFLIVMAIPSLVRFLAALSPPSAPDPWGGASLGRLGARPDATEPDDRDDPLDGPWWRDAG